MKNASKFSFLFVLLFRFSGRRIFFCIDSLKYIYRIIRKFHFSFNRINGNFIRTPESRQVSKMFVYDRIFMLYRCFSFRMPVFIISNSIRCETNSKFEKILAKCCRNKMFRRKVLRD